MTLGKQASYGKGFRVARAEALSRSGGVCQFCGQRPATDGHHWAEEYPPDSEISGDDLTGLCAICHTVATKMRRHVRAGGSIFDFVRALTKAMET